MADPSPCPCSDLNPTPEDHPLGRLRRTHDHLSRLATKRQRMKRKGRALVLLLMAEWEQTSLHLNPTPTFANLPAVYKKQQNPSCSLSPHWPVLNKQESSDVEKTWNKAMNRRARKYKVYECDRYLNRYLVLHDFGQARWNCRHLLRQENKADSEAVDLTQSYEVSIGKLLNKEDGWRHLSADGGQGIEKSLSSGNSALSQCLDSINLRPFTDSINHRLLTNSINHRLFTDSINHRLFTNSINLRLFTDSINQRMLTDSINLRLFTDSLNHRLFTDSLNHRLFTNSINLRLFTDSTNQRSFRLLNHRPFSDSINLRLLTDSSLCPDHAWVGLKSFLWPTSSSFHFQFTMALPFGHQIR
ncbi:hypothetical protein NN561_003945 [Cricetulus griseus]